MAQNQDKPPKVSLNVDTLEREGASEEPFVAAIDGRPVTFNDPLELDWQELLASYGNPRAFLRLVLSKEDATRVLGMKIPTWKIRRIMSAFNAHYGLPDDPGELNASSGF
jgi:hypothetical protein